MLRKITDLISGPDAIARSQIAPLEALGLNFLTYDDGEYQTKIAGEFIELRRSPTGELLFRVTIGRPLQRSGDAEHGYYTTPNYPDLVNDHSGAGVSKTRGRVEQQHLMHYDPPARSYGISANNYSPGALGTLGSGANDVNYAQAVGYRRSWRVGRDKYLSVKEGDNESYFDAPIDEWRDTTAASYVWNVGSMLSGTNVRDAPACQLTVATRVRIGIVPGKGGNELAGGSIFNGALEARANAVTQDDDGNVFRLTHASTDTNYVNGIDDAFVNWRAGSPFGGFWNAYSIAAPARTDRGLAFGVATLNVDPAFDPRTLDAAHQLWIGGGYVNSIRYSGRVGRDAFTTTITPEHVYSTPFNVLAAHLMPPIVTRVGPKTLCMVVYSVPAMRPVTTDEASEADARALRKAYSTFVGTSKYSTDPNDPTMVNDYTENATGPVPPHFAFLFWSEDNGRTWQQLPDALWHMPIIGASSNWAVVSLRAVMMHMMQHTTFLQDRSGACFMVVAMPHGADWNFDFGNVATTMPTSGIRQVVPLGFFRARPRAEVAAINYSAAGAQTRFAHDKLGLFDTDLSHSINGSAMLSLRDGFFNSDLWRYDVFRVTRGAVSHIATLPADYPPCDWAVSRASGPTRSKSYIQLKPVYSSVAESVLLVSGDGWQSWAVQPLRNPDGLDHARGTGLVYPMGRDALFCSFAKRTQNEHDGGYTDAVSGYSSNDFGKTWKRIARLFKDDVSAADALPYRGGYPIFDLINGTSRLYLPTRGDRVTMMDAAYASDLAVASIAGSDAELNVARPWLNDSAISEPTA